MGFFKRLRKGLHGCFTQRVVHTQAPKAFPDRSSKAKYILLLVSTWSLEPNTLKVLLEEPMKEPLQGTLLGTAEP